MVAELAPRSAGTFGMVGVTWDRTRGVGDVTVEVRLRQKDGWTSWQELPVEHDTVDVGRPGTEPMYVGDSEGVAVRVRSSTGVTPKGVKVDTIDLGAAETVDAAPAFTPQPSIITRSQWGASAGEYCDSPQSGPTTFGVAVHHTAGSNSYAKSSSASIVRGIQAYHVKSRDWCDIGYNFLVDKYGQIFEGRRGGMDRNVRGAHAGDFKVNTYSMGVAMMGNFDTAHVGSAMADSMVELIGWRLGTFYRPATGTWSANGKKYQIIFGHRNVVSTACPGRYGYAWLPSLRERVATYISGYTSEIKTYAAGLGRSFTGYVYRGERGTSTQRKTLYQDMEIYWKEGLGAHAVSGYVRKEYNHLGYQNGPLGYPASEWLHTDDPKVTLMRFEGGTVYRVVRPTGVIGLGIYGDIEDTYRDLGESTGALGAPETRIYRLSAGGARARFDHGYITQMDGQAPVVTYR